MIYLTKEEILLIHSMVIDETGGSHGVRDHHALAALEDLPKQMAFGKELYATVFDKGAVYIRNIIGSHPFVDGNKRTAMTAAAVFFELNRYRSISKEGEIEKMALQIIQEKLTLSAIAKWLKRHTRKVHRK